MTRIGGNADEMLAFNDAINQAGLIELPLKGKKFTWTNKQEAHVMVNLDIILVSVSWETKYPLSNAWSITRVGSDHVPIILMMEWKGSLDLDFFLNNSG